MMEPHGTPRKVVNRLEDQPGKKVVSRKGRRSGPELHKEQFAGVKDKSVRKKMKEKALKKRDSGMENPHNRINFK